MSGAVMSSTAHFGLFRHFTPWLDLGIARKCAFGCPLRSSAPRGAYLNCESQIKAFHKGTLRFPSLRVSPGVYGFPCRRHSAGIAIWNDSRVCRAASGTARFLADGQRGGSANRWLANQLPRRRTRPYGRHQGSTPTRYGRRRERAPRRLPPPASTPSRHGPSRLAQWTALWTARLERRPRESRLLGRNAATIVSRDRYRGPPVSVCPRKYLSGP
jgi:hypothetical protein